MAELRSPYDGAVIDVADGLVKRYVAAGWVGGEQADDGAPRGNASRDEWAAYAATLGVEVAEDAKRDDIKAAIAAAGE